MSYTQTKTNRKGAEAKFNVHSTHPFKSETISKNQKKTFN